MCGVRIFEEKIVLCKKGDEITGLDGILLRVNFNDFVTNNPDNCSFNHFFFPVYFYQVPFSLLP